MKIVGGLKLTYFVVDYEVERDYEDHRKNHSECQEPTSPLGPVSVTRTHEQQIETDNSEAIDQTDEDALLGGLVIHIIRIDESQSALSV